MCTAAGSHALMQKLPLDAVFTGSSHISMAGDEGLESSHPLLQAAQEFHAFWFPDELQPNSVQSFWFGAKRPRDRKLFKQLCQKFCEPLRTAEQLHEIDPSWFQRLGPASQLRLAIFLDQQSRNQRATLDRNQGQQSEEASNVENQIVRCSRIARELADRLLQTRISCADIMGATGASNAQICFLTLVLRHTQELGAVRAAQRLLDEMQESVPVVAAFRQRNSEILLKMESEAYVREALERHTPRKASYDGSGHSPLPTICLDSACVNSSGALSPNCLSWASHSERWDQLASHPLSQEMLRELRKRSLMTPEAHVLLSYSGGVDSTAHLLLLLALRRRFKMPGLSCLMLSYPNRQPEEVEAEQLWATWVCHQLQVDLYIYDVNLARPHADVASTACGLSREDYERWTKEIRYKMYRSLLPTTEGSAVVLGHHQDDVDENRLDHLMKGHVLGDVEGMWAWRRIHDVQLCRPLLHKRKADFLSLLQEFPTPFFRDSTPPWSVRGATRSALDSLQPDVREILVSRLQSFGELSLEVGSMLDRAVDSWTQDHVCVLSLPRGARGIALNLDALFSLEVGHGLAEVESLISEIRQLWNPLLSLGAEKETEVSKQTPLSAIPEHSFDVPALLFERGFLAAAQGQGDLVSRRLGHYHSSESISVNRKAVHHLFANIRNCMKPHFSGGLSQEFLACKDLTSSWFVLSNFRGLRNVMLLPVLLPLPAALLPPLPLVCKV